VGRHAGAWLSRSTQGAPRASTVAPSDACDRPPTRQHELLTVRPDGSLRSIRCLSHTISDHHVTTAFAPLSCPPRLIARVRECGGRDGGGAAPPPRPPERTPATGPVAGSERERICPWKGHRGAAPRYDGQARARTGTNQAEGRRHPENGAKAHREGRRGARGAEREARQGSEERRTDDCVSSAPLAGGQLTLTRHTQPVAIATTRTIDLRVTTSPRWPSSRRGCLAANRP